MNKFQDNFEQLKREQETLNSLLEKYKIDYRVISSIKIFFEKNRSYFIERKKSREILKNDLKAQKKLVSELKKKYEKASKFSFNKIMPFFAEVISIYEKEDYQFEIIKLDDIIIQPLPMEMSYPTIINNSIGVIAKRRFINKAKKRYFKDKSNIYQFFSLYYEKNLILNKEETIDLLNNEENLRSLSASFPYLEGVCHDLILDRLNDLNINEKELFKRYLTNLMKEKNPKYKQFQKKS